MRYGWAIRTGGDAEIAGALESGIRAGSPDPASRRTELERRVAADLQNLAFRRHTPEEIETMITRARYEYGQATEPSRLARRLLTAWAGMWMMIWSCRGWRTGIRCGGDLFRPASRATFPSGEGLGRRRA